MRKLLISTSALLVLITSPALAHTLASDDPISATVHVSPNESPIPGEVATLLFEFKDPNRKFSAAACECVVKIVQNDKELERGALGQNVSDVSDVHAEFYYTFPEIGDYTVRLLGRPREGSEFTPFELEYRVSVGGQPSFITSAKHHLAHFAVGGILGGTVIGLIIFNGLKKRQEPVA